MKYPYDEYSTSLRINTLDLHVSTQINTTKILQIKPSCRIEYDALYLIYKCVKQYLSLRDKYKCIINSKKGSEIINTKYSKRGEPKF